MGMPAFYFSLVQTYKKKKKDDDKEDEEDDNKDEEEALKMFRGDDIC